MPDYNNNYWDSPWYSQEDKIKKVVIEDGVTNIGNSAFDYCYKLTSVTIPNSVTSIGSAAFYGCHSLTSVTIPNSVTSIGSNAFENTKWYGNQPDGLIYAGKVLYRYKGTMPSNTKIEIKEGTTEIAGGAFYGCSGLTSIVIPNSVTNIGSDAFYGCSGLTSITIPNSVKSIEYSAFQDCSSLTSVTIPKSVTSIGYAALGGCTGLTSIIVEKGNTYYDSRDNCNAIIETKSNTLINGCKNTIIPNSVTNIGIEAFYGCSGLTSIVIPNSVTNIGSDAFYGCSGLTSIVIPNSVTNIGDGAFYGCSGLTSIVIPNSVTNIGDYPFYGCSGLTSIVIPNSVTNIGDDAFYGCSGLTSIVIPNSVTNIGSEAFSGCSGLTSIVIPNSVTNIGSEPFGGCSGLTSITCEATTPPTCGYNYHVNKLIPVYVPANSVDAYRKAKEWKDFTNIQAIPSTSLTDGTPYTSNLQLNGRDISYTRTFNNTSWQSLYIPFSLNYDDWKDDFEVAYINGVRQLDKDDNGTIDETIMDVIKIKSGSTTPNMPYLIKAKTTGEKTFSVNDATLYPAEENSIDCSTTIAKYTFTGTYNTISSATMIANNYYGMGGGELVQSDGSNDLMPYRWYMNVESRNSSYNASNAAKTITINVIGDEESETTTGIRQLQITNDELPVYDLNGRKINENNLKPGIYVKNGKKFVVK